MKNEIDWQEDLTISLCRFRKKEFPILYKCDRNMFNTTLYTFLEGFWDFCYHFWHFIVQFFFIIIFQCVSFNSIFRYFIILLFVLKMCVLVYTVFTSFIYFCKCIRIYQTSSKIVSSEICQSPLKKPEWSTLGTTQKMLMILSPTDLSDQQKTSKNNRT